LKYQHKHIIPPLDSCSFQRNPERHSKVSLQKTKVSDLVILHCTHPRVPHKAYPPWSILKILLVRNYYSKCTKNAFCDL
jgi:hypothetical protein